MKSFIEVLNEAKSMKEIIAGIPALQGNPVEVFLGRMQPIHNGHIKAIKKMKNPVIVLVKGEQSSKDKKKNPFDAQYQQRLLKKALGANLRIIVSRTGFIPEILSAIRGIGFEPVTIVAGPDRFGKYKGQVDSINKSLPEEKKFRVKMKEAERVTSATKVRDAIRNGDLPVFRKVMPKELHGEWKTMRNLLKDAV